MISIRDARAFRFPTTDHNSVSAHAPNARLFSVRTWLPYCRRRIGKCRWSSAGLSSERYLRVRTACFSHINVLLNPLGGRARRKRRKLVHSTSGSKNRKAARPAQSREVRSRLAKDDRISGCNMRMETQHRSRVAAGTPPTSRITRLATA